MNNTTKIEILSYDSQPDKSYNYFGDNVEYDGKLYFVSLAEELCLRSVQLYMQS